MKKQLTIILTALLLFAATSAYAQAPQGFNYQAALRDNTGAILASQAVDLRFSIRDSSETGTILYRESQAGTTSAQGLFSHAVGMGTADQGTFAGIIWGPGIKYLQVEVSIAGGTYTDLGTQQLMSVPYAFNADFAEYAIQATYANSATNAGNATNATNASHANNADNALNATNAIHAATSTYSDNAIDAIHADSATYAINATNAVNATYATTATTSLDNKWALNGSEIVTTTNGGATVNGQYLTVNSGGEAAVKLLNSGNAVYLTNGGYGSYAGRIVIGGNTASMCINTVNNYVGIGTTFPEYPLDVDFDASGTPAQNIAAYSSWFYPGSGFAQNTLTTTNGTVSIHGRGWIVSHGGFMAYSDARLKNVIGVTNTANDLSTLEQIQITDYTMRDVASNSALTKKVIAQQLQTVYPQAVKVSDKAQFIANLYQLVSSYSINGQTIEIALSKPIEGKDKNDIIAGAEIKFYLSEKGEGANMKEVQGKVTAVNGDKLTITTTEDIDAAKYDKLFAYGTMVTGLLSVDYEAIAMLNVSATQELSKKIAALEAENAALKTSVQDLNTANATLKSDVDAIKQQLGLSAQK